MTNILSYIFQGPSNAVSGAVRCKRNHDLSVVRFIIFVLALGICSALPLRAESQSQHLPVSAVVSKIQSDDLLLDDLMPSFYRTSIRQIPDCIPARSEQVKVWKFSGFKAKSESVQQKLGPDVGCIVTISIHREGISKISTVDESATISFPIVVNMTTTTDGEFGGAFEFSKASQASVEMTLNGKDSDVNSSGIYELTWLGPDRAFLPNGDAVNFIDSKDLERALYSVNSGELVRASRQDISDLTETLVDDVE